MKKMNLLHGVLIIGLAAFGLNYQGRQAGYENGVKNTETKIEQMQKNYEQEINITENRAYNDGYKTARLFDKIETADMKAKYDNEIETLNAVHEVEIDGTQNDWFKRGWDRCLKEYTPREDITYEDEPLERSTGGSPDSMDSRVGNEKLLKALQGVREVTDIISEYEIPNNRTDCTSKDATKFMR